MYVLLRRSLQNKVLIGWLDADGLKQRGSVAALVRPLLSFYVNELKSEDEQMFPGRCVAKNCPPTEIGLNCASCFKEEF